MKNKIKMVLGSILVILAFSLLILFSILQNRVKPIPEGSVGNTAGNANNGGCFCEYNGTVYFSNPYDGGALYSMSPDETNLKKIISANTSHLNAGGKYLFYYQKGSSENGSGLGNMSISHGLYRSDLNGRNVISLVRMPIFNLQLIDNYLYFLSSGNKGEEFCKIKIDKTDKSILTHTGWNFSSAMPDGTVYYNGTQNNHFLYRYNTKTNSSSVVWEGNLWFPVYDNGYIYYLSVDNEYKLCRYSLANEVVEILTHDRVDCFNLAGGYLYYQKNSVDEPALKRMTLDGKEPEIIAEGNYTHINVTSKYVYFSAFGSEIPLYRTPIDGPISVNTFHAAMEAVVDHIK